MCNIPQEVPQAFMDGSLPSRHTETGLRNGAALQHIINNQQTANRKQAQAVRQEIAILPFCCIQENYIVRAFQCGQDICRIAFQDFDFVFQSHSFDVYSCVFQHHFKAVNGCYRTVFRQVTAHESC